MGREDSCLTQVRQKENCGELQRWEWLPGDSFALAQEKVTQHREGIPKKHQEGGSGLSGVYLHPSDGKTSRRTDLVMGEN